MQLVGKKSLQNKQMRACLLRLSGLISLIIPSVSFASDDALESVGSNALTVFTNDITKWVIIFGLIGVLLAFFMGRLEKSTVIKFIITGAGLLSVQYLADTIFNITV